jgi:hypothetical protein
MHSASCAVAELGSNRAQRGADRNFPIPKPQAGLRFVPRPARPVWRADHPFPAGPPATYLAADQPHRDDARCRVRSHAASQLPGSGRSPNTGPRPSPASGRGRWPQRPSCCCEPCCGSNPTYQRAGSGSTPRTRAHAARARRAPADGGSAAHPRHRPEHLARRWPAERDGARLRPHDASVKTALLITPTWPGR